jgi:hypothetical protein
MKEFRVICGRSGKEAKCLNESLSVNWRSLFFAILRIFSFKRVESLETGKVKRKEDGSR